MIMFETVTDEEEQKIQELRRRTLHELSPRLYKDETIFYRFLKARDFNLKHAEAMLRKHIADCKFYDLEYIVNEYKIPELLLKYAPICFLGFDKSGSVIRYLDLGGLDVKGYLTLFSKIELLRHSGHLLHKDIDQLTEQTKLGRPASKIVYILNFDKLNLFKATYKKGLDMLYDLCLLFQNNYPERVKAIYIINAAFYFHLAFPIFKSVLSVGLLDKISVFGSSGWKEALLEIIDADTLPAFLGGTKTDPDGNPLCNSFVVHAQPIPEELYSKKRKKTMINENGVKNLIVSRFSSSEIPLYVYEIGTLIEWEFETKNRDIAFSLYYKDNKQENSKPTELIPKQRIDTMLASEAGMYKCEKVGTYIMEFDNSYSWIFSKEIYYRIRLVKSSDSSDLMN